MSSGVRHALARIRASRRRKENARKPNPRAWSGGLPVDLYMAVPERWDELFFHVARRGSA